MKFAVMKIPDPITVPITNDVAPTEEQKFSLLHKCKKISPIPIFGFTPVSILTSLVILPSVVQGKENTGRLVRGPVIASQQWTP